eukprot:g4967.t1
MGARFSRCCATPWVVLLWYKAVSCALGAAGAGADAALAFGRRQGKVRALHDNVGIVAVADQEFAERWPLMYATQRTYARHHGYDYKLLSPATDAPGCHTTGGHFFFRKHCTVRYYLSKQPPGYALLVLDGDVLASNVAASLDPWLSDHADVIVHGDAVSFEVMAGNYLVRNTEFGRHFLDTWYQFYHLARLVTGFNSGGGGAIRLVLLHLLASVLPRRHSRSFEQCSKMYLALRAPITDLAPYHKYVGCTRRALGPARQWEVKMPVPGRLTVLNQHHGFVHDGHMWRAHVNARVPFQHGAKDMSQSDGHYGFDFRVSQPDGAWSAWRRGESVWRACAFDAAARCEMRMRGRPQQQDDRHGTGSMGWHFARGKHHKMLWIGVERPSRASRLSKYGSILAMASEKDCLAMRDDLCDAQQALHDAKAKIEQIERHTKRLTSGRADALAMDVNTLASIRMCRRDLADALHLALGTVRNGGSQRHACHGVFTCCCCCCCRKDQRDRLSADVEKEKRDLRWASRLDSMLELLNMVTDVLFLLVKLPKDAALFTASLWSLCATLVMRLGIAWWYARGRVDWCSPLKLLCFLGGLLLSLLEPHWGGLLLKCSFRQRESNGENKTWDPVQRQWVSDRDRIAVEAANSLAVAQQQQKTSAPLVLQDLAGLVIESIYLSKYDAEDLDVIFVAASTATILHLWRNLSEAWQLQKDLPLLKCTARYRDKAFAKDARDEDVQAFAKDAGAEARVVNLSVCTEVTERSVQTLAHRCLMLSTINLYKCGGLTAGSVQALACHCPALTNVNLGAGGRLVSDDSVALLARKCKGLSIINLGYCPAITDQSVLALAQHCRALTCVQLSGCPEVTDGAVKALAEGCVELAVVRVDKCPKLTDDAVTALATRCKRLSTLDMRGCPELTDEAVRALADSHLQLSSVQLSTSDKLTDQSVEHLRATHPECKEQLEVTELEAELAKLRKRNSNFRL